MGDAAIRVVGLCCKPDSAPAGEAAGSIAAWLRARGIEVWLDPEAAGHLGEEARDRTTLASKADLLVVLGGDGTLLSVVRELASREVPILGVNLGRVGFLAEVAPDEQFAMLERVLADEHQTMARMRLRVTARRDEAVLLEANALNDAVLTRADLSRMIDLEVTADGAPVTTVHGDGLIVATPTGSTAYTLSAGGPILLPGSEVFVMTPICPHTLTQRPVVLPRTARITVQVRPREGSAQLTVDGQVGVLLENGDTVTVEVASHPATFVVSPYLSRFDVLRTKLGWGRSQGEEGG